MKPRNESPKSMSIKVNASLLMCVCGQTVLHIVFISGMKFKALVIDPYLVAVLNQVEFGLHEEVSLDGY